ncbi:MAG TPA: glycoside hydrolase family 2 TIM barrel-domain containing protein [Mycobacteriales bacterium]|nr:glycoside hydrolase family 2 TIM barrel-domain containing protein [Mycobacteriales bacterium]
MRRFLVLLVAALLCLPATLAATASTPRRYVAVLDAAGLSAVGVPAGLTPAWASAALNADGIRARLVSPAAIPAGATALVNPYGEAFPDTPAVEAELAKGVGWVNVAGVPFLAPNGTGDSASPAKYGVFAPPTPDTWFTGTKRLELGRALLPGWPSTTTDHTGVTVHGETPADERPLAEYIDAAGVDGGPAVSLILAPDRVVAVGLTGDASPLAPTARGSAALLGELTRLAAQRASATTIRSVSVTRNDNWVDVRATGDGTLTGVGSRRAGPLWSPARPRTQLATIRLYQDHRLVDLRTIVLNPASIAVSGRDLVVDGRPFVVKGTVEGEYPPSATPLQQAAITRQDFARMHRDGINAIRSYGYMPDWEFNLAARDGIFTVNEMPFGALSNGAVDQAVPWAKFYGAGDLNRPNVLMFSLGNETQDSGFGSPASVNAMLARLASAYRSTDGHVHPITYAAAEEEPWLLGKMPFLDVYGYNDYGAAYPFSYDRTGFAVALKIAQAIAGDRPMVLTEYGVNNTPTGQTALVVPSTADALAAFQQAAVYEKWQSLRSLGAAGGFYFQWADKLTSSFPLPIPFYSQTLGAIEYPPGSGYHPTNEEDFWGLNTVERKPRPILAALIYAYTGKGTRPPNLPLP